MPTIQLRGAVFRTLNEAGISVPNRHDVRIDIPGKVVEVALADVADADRAHTVLQSPKSSPCEPEYRFVAAPSHAESAPKPAD